MEHVQHGLDGLKRHGIADREDRASGDCGQDEALDGEKATCDEALGEFLTQIPEQAEVEVHVVRREQEDLDSQPFDEHPPARPLAVEGGYTPLAKRIRYTEEKHRIPGKALPQPPRLVPPG